MTSIRQNLSDKDWLRRWPALPDFGNLGIWLRILLGVHALALLFALAGNRQLGELPGELAALAAVLEWPLIASLLLLRALHARLAGLSARAATLAVFGVVLLSTACAQQFGALFLPAGMFGVTAISLPRSLFWAALTTAAMLLYFDTRARLQSPALAEARLMALTARIRPHFLFNALNAVLGVIRSEPRRAEAALEELADLFRVLMRENRELVKLSEEIALARQYLALEKLRLGERLQVVWDIESCPPDALMPPLMLQPLLENAVYHGIEPLSGEQPGEIRIGFAQRGELLQIEMTNPCDPARDTHAGNQMALANIRERLALFYDLEAGLEAGVVESGRYRVRITLPYRQRPNGLGGLGHPGGLS